MALLRFPFDIDFNFEGQFKNGIDTFFVIPMLTGPIGIISHVGLNRFFVAKLVAGVDGNARKWNQIG